MDSFVMNLAAQELASQEIIRLPAAAASQPPPVHARRDEFLKVSVAPTVAAIVAIVPMLIP